MTRWKNLRRLLAAGAAAAVAVAMTTVGVDADDTSDASSGPVLERVWVGEPSDRMEDVAFELEQLVADHPEVFSGLAFTADFGAVEVYYAASGARTAHALVDQASSPPTGQSASALPAVTMPDLRVRVQS